MHISVCVHYPSWPLHSFLSSSMHISVFVSIIHHDLFIPSFPHQWSSLCLCPLSIMTSLFLPFLINGHLCVCVHYPSWPLYSFLSSSMHISVFVSIIHHDLFIPSFPHQCTSLCLCPLSIMTSLFLPFLINGHLCVCVHYPSWPLHSLFSSSMHISVFVSIIHHDLFSPSFPHQCTSLCLCPLSIMTSSFLRFLINAHLCCVCVHYPSWPLHSFVSSSMIISVCVHYPSWPLHSFLSSSMDISVLCPLSIMTSLFLRFLINDHLCLHPLSIMTSLFLPFLINGHLCVVSIIHHDLFIPSFPHQWSSLFVSIIHHDLFIPSCPHQCTSLCLCPLSSMTSSIDPFPHQWSYLCLCPLSIMTSSFLPFLINAHLCVCVHYPSWRLHSFLSSSMIISAFVSGHYPSWPLHSFRCRCTSLRF